jgi:hypothetical protein
MQGGREKEDKVMSRNIAPRISRESQRRTAHMDEKTERGETKANTSQKMSGTRLKQNDRLNAPQSTLF